MPSEGLGAGSLAPRHPHQRKLENHRRSGRPHSASLAFPRLWVRALPPPLPWECARGALLPVAATSVPSPGDPNRGRSKLGMGAPARRPLASAGSCGCGALGAHGAGKGPACLSQTWVRARQALSPRPRLSFPDQEMGPGCADGVRPPGTPSPGRALTTPRLRSSARGAGAAQLPRAASASSSSGSGGTRARGRGGPGIALTGRAARRGRPRAARAQRAAPGRLSRPAAGRGGAC